MKNDDTGSSTFDKTGCWQPPITTPLPKSFACRASRLTVGLMSTHMLPDCQSLVGRRQSLLECRPSGDLIVGRRIVARRTVSRSTWYRPHDVRGQTGKNGSTQNVWTAVWRHTPPCVTQRHLPAQKGVIEAGIKQRLPCHLYNPTICKAHFKRVSLWSRLIQTCRWSTESETPG